MAVAYDASSEAHTSTTGSTNEASFSWNHTPSGTPAGVLVFVWTNANGGTGLSTGVTYGGVAVPAVSGGEASDTAGEPGNCKAYFLGSGVPSGQQSVVVSRTNNAVSMSASAITVTAVNDTAVHTGGIVLVTGDSTVAEQSVTDGTNVVNSVRFAAGHFGHQTPPTAGANSTLIQSIDTGGQCFVTVRETTAGSGSRSVGMSSGTSDDRAIVHLAVKEVVSPAIGALSLAGVAPTMFLAFNMALGATPLALAGQTPSVAVSAVATSPTILIQRADLRFKGPADPDRALGMFDGALAFTGYAPTASVSSSGVSIPIAAGTLSGPGQTPTLAFTQPITAGACTLSGQIPLLASTLPASAGALTVSGPTPSVAVDDPTPISAGTLALTGTAVSLASTVPVGAGALVLSGQVPVASSGLLVPIGVGGLTLAGLTPTRQVDLPIPIGAGALRFKGPAQAGSVTGQPGVGSLTITGLAPAIASGALATPAAGALTLSGYAPTGLVGVTLSPSAGALTLSGQFVAIVFQGPSAGALTLTGYAPTLQITGQTTLAPAAGVLTLTGLTPVRLTAELQTPAAGTLTLTGQTPALAFVLPVGAGALTWTGVAPSLPQAGTYAPDAGILTFAGPVPTVGISGTSVPDPAALVLTGLVPVASVGSFAIPGAGTLTLTGSTSSLALTLPPSVGSLILTGPAPTSNASDSIVCAIGVGVLTLTGTSLIPPPLEIAFTVEVYARPSVSGATYRAPSVTGQGYEGES